MISLMNFSTSLREYVILLPKIHTNLMCNKYIVMGVILFNTFHCLDKFLEMYCYWFLQNT